MVPARTHSRSRGCWCCACPARPTPRLVQGELAAGEDAGARPARLRPVQNNLAFNARRGTTRGIHTEPWDKFVSVAPGGCSPRGSTSATAHPTGRPSTWRSTRGPRSSSRVASATATRPSTTARLHLPRQRALATRRTSTRAAARRPHRGDPVADPPRGRRRLREGPHHPVLRRRPVDAHPTTLILGSDGQLGRALVADVPGRRPPRPRRAGPDRPGRGGGWRWHDYDLVLNASAYTAVDAAETSEEGAGPPGRQRVARRRPWPGCREHRLTLVHFSTDYVFDGTTHRPHRGRAVLTAGRLRADQGGRRRRGRDRARHYLMRTSWLVGDGGNFVRTMQRLAAEGVAPSVVDDQVGRLTFATSWPARRGTCWTPARRTAPTTLRLRAGDELGDAGATGLRRCPGATRATSRRSRPRSTPPVATSLRGRARAR